MELRIGDTFKYCGEELKVVEYISTTLSKQCEHCYLYNCDSADICNILLCLKGERSDNKNIILEKVVNKQ